MNCAASFAKTKLSPIRMPISPSICAHKFASKSKRGKTDQQIKDYMVARYGDFVLYQPAGAVEHHVAVDRALLVTHWRYRIFVLAVVETPKLITTQQLSAEENQRADALLQNSAPTIQPSNKT